MASGGSVIAVKYDGGVFMAADTLLSYGSLAKQTNIPRMAVIGNATIIGFSGDYADFQDATKDLKNEVLDAQMLEDRVTHGPKQLFSLLHRTVYGKRSNFEPWQCQFTVMGWDKEAGEAFLGGMDSIGTKWTGDCVSTGYGGHICLPLLRKAIEGKKKATGNPNALLTRDEAIAVLEDCMKGLFYRECRAVNRFQVSEAKADRVNIGDPKVLETNWEYSGYAFEKTAIIK